MKPILCIGETKGTVLFYDKVRLLYTTRVVVQQREIQGKDPLFRLLQDSFFPHPSFLPSFLPFFNVETPEILILDTQPRETHTHSHTNVLMPCMIILFPAEEYDLNIKNEVCAMQLSKDLVGVTKEQMKDVVIAYEPVWAIGTGLVCGAEEASKLKPFAGRRTRI